MPNRKLLKAIIENDFYLCSFNNMSFKCPDCEGIGVNEEYTCTTCWQCGGDGSYTIEEILNIAYDIKFHGKNKSDISNESIQDFLLNYDEDHIVRLYIDDHRFQELNITFNDLKALLDKENYPYEDIEEDDERPDLNHITLLFDTFLKHLRV